MEASEPARVRLWRTRAVPHIGRPECGYLRDQVVTHMGRPERVLSESGRGARGPPNWSKRKVVGAIRVIARAQRGDVTKCTVAAKRAWCRLWARGAEWPRPGRKPCDGRESLERGVSDAHQQK